MVLPDSIAQLLPTRDRLAPAVALTDDQWAVAGAHALAVVAPGRIVTAGMWYEVQTLGWDADTQRLQVVWSDPGRVPFSGVTACEPVDFMRVARERLAYTQVSLRSLRADNGTRIVAQIRRGPDGALFSVVTASGPLDEAAKHAADRLEWELREAVGLE